MMPTPEDEERALAVRRLRRRRAFWMLLLTYVAVNLFLVGVWAFTGRGYFWPIWVMLGWGIGVVLAAIGTFVSGTFMGKPSEDEIKREMDRRRDRAA